jgi:hypothetical protein
VAIDELSLNMRRDEFYAIMTYVFNNVSHDDEMDKLLMNVLPNPDDPISTSVLSSPDDGQGPHPADVGPHEGRRRTQLLRSQLLHVSGGPLEDQRQEPEHPNLRARHERRPLQPPHRRQPRSRLLQVRLPQACRAIRPLLPLGRQRKRGCGSQPRRHDQKRYAQHEHPRNRTEAVHSHETECSCGGPSQLGFPLLHGCQPEQVRRQRHQHHPQRDRN